MINAFGDGALSNEGVVERSLAQHAVSVMAFDVVDREEELWPLMVADGCDMLFED